MSNICPWCDAELFWDEEDGPEDVCPHCLNELGNYRSVSIDGNGAGDDEQELTSDVNQDLPQLTKLQMSAEMQAYARAVLNEQEEWLLCNHCEEAMIHIGAQTIAVSAFQARKWHGQAMMSAPFKMELFICPNCDRVEQVLSIKDRLAWHERATNNK